MQNNIFQNTPAWEEIKLNYIGGSEIYSLIWHYQKEELQKLGVNLLKEKPFRSPLELFVKIKHGKINNNISQVNSEFGLGMESYIISRLNSDLPQIKASGTKEFMINSNIHPIAACSPDGFIELVSDSHELPDFDKTCIIQHDWGLGLLENKTARFGFNFDADFGTRWQYIFQLQYNMMVTGCKWGILAVLAPKEAEMDTDFFKGQMIEKARNNKYDEITQNYNLYHYVFKAIPKAQEIIINALNAFQKDLDSENYPLSNEDDLTMRVQDKSALSLVFPESFGILKADQQIDDLLNQRMIADIEEKKAATEKKEYENKIIILTKKYNEIQGGQYKAKWTSNGQLRFYSNKT